MVVDFARRIFSNPNRLRRLGSEGGWIIAGQVATVAGSLASVRVLTGYLSPTHYGDLALALTLYGLASQVFTGGLIAGIGRFYSIAVEQADLHQYLKGSLLCMNRAIVALFGVAISSYNSALSSIQSAARQRIVVALHASGDAWLKIALAVLLLRLFGISASTVVVGFAISAFFVTVSQLCFLRKLSAQHAQVINELRGARFYLSTTRLENAYGSAAEGIFLAPEALISDIPPHRDLLSGEPFETVHVPGLNLAMLRVRRRLLTGVNLRTWDSVIAEMLNITQYRLGSVVRC